MDEARAAIASGTLEGLRARTTAVWGA